MNAISSLILILLSFEQLINCYTNVSFDFYFLVAKFFLFLSLINLLNLLVLLHI